MLQLRTSILMKTDIVESTPQFRALLSSDLQAVLSRYRAMVARIAADEGGRILKSGGDGYWLDFPSATAAAKSAIAMHDALRLEQATKGDDRLSMRIVIGLGDTATQDGEPMGDVLALITRIEDLTPADEIYLTTAARLALTPSEIKTALVGRFSLKGFPEEESVYRVEQRHRTQVLADAWILLTDLRGFGRFIEIEPESTVEELLDALDLLVGAVVHEYEGTVRFAIGDSYCVMFREAVGAITAAEKISRNWAAESRGTKFYCPINICLHRGTMKVFRSFVYGAGISSVGTILPRAFRLFGAEEGNVFVTNQMREALRGSAWQERLRSIASESLSAEFPGLTLFRLDPK
jgi:class 3 adenylate cyclase